VKTKRKKTLFEINRSEWEEEKKKKKKKKVIFLFFIFVCRGTRLFTFLYSIYARFLLRDIIIIIIIRFHMSRPLCVVIFLCLVQHKSYDTHRTICNTCFTNDSALRVRSYNIILLLLLLLSCTVIISLNTL